MVHDDDEHVGLPLKSVNVNKCCVNQKRLQQQNAGNKGSYAQLILALLMARESAKRKSATNGAL
ncbi:TPA: hypothetical protein ACOXZ8_004517 [Escherichia coli]